MANEIRDLTAKQSDFVTAYIETGFNRELAEKAAGYSKNAGYKPLAMPHVQAEIDRRIEADYAEADALVVRHVLRILRADDVTPTSVFKAGELIGKRRNGFAAKAGDGFGKQPHEMTADELAAEIEKLEAAAAQRARQVGEKGDASAFD